MFVARCEMMKLVGGAAFVGVLMLYLAPAIVADARERKDAFAVTMVNIVLGRTVVGWFAALVWARYPVSDRRLTHVAKKAKRAVARVTIDALVSRVRSRSALGSPFQPRLVPVEARTSPRRIGPSR
jgi:hypothetical protein